MQNIVIKYVVDDSQLNKSRESSQRAQRATDELRNSTNKYSKDVKQAGSDGQKAFNQISAAVKGISFVVAAKELLDFTKQVIAVRGEFQKFEAVLTNTLGSKSAALIALGRINEFAKSTPFGVKELTENFIKLANRGVQPTIQQMRAIADLSATLGKDFSQVVEAILDINNPERWKEIGVKAETAGNKVRLSFRNVTQEVDRTVEGVTKAVVELGKLNGVAGSTEAISGTLSGQVSNLEDSWQQLLNTIGKGNEGVLFNAVSLLGQAIDKANQLLKGSGQRFEEQQASTLGREVSDFEKLAETLGDVNKAFALVDQKRKERMKEISLRQQELFKQDPDDMNILQVQEREKELEFLRNLYSILDTDLPTALQESISKMEAKNNVDVKATGIVQDLREKIKSLNDEIERTKSLGDLGSSGKLIKQRNTAQDELDRLLGKEPDSDKNRKKKLEEFQKDLEAEAEADIKFRERTAEDRRKRQRENDKRSFELWKYFQDLRVQKTRETEDEKLRIEEEAAIARLEFQKSLEETAFQIAGDQIRSLVSAEADAYSERIFRLRNFYDEQLLLAGDNENAKKQLRLEEERDIQDLERKRADREKKSVLGGIIANTALAIIKIFAGEGTYVDKLIRAGIMTAEGASQYAAASKARYYSKGELNIKGPGSETSDSIPAFLSKGESVMTAKQTRESFGILTDVRAGKLNDRVLRQIVHNGGAQASMSDERIVSELKGIRKGQYNLERQYGNLYQAYKDSEGNIKRNRVSIFIK